MALPTDSAIDDTGRTNLIPHVRGEKIAARRRAILHMDGFPRQARPGTGFSGENAALRLARARIETARGEAAVRANAVRSA
jgi:hypothetical protein